MRERENVVERVFAETEGRGADAVILAVGGNALIKTAMDAVRPGGKVMLFAQTQHGEATLIPARCAWTRRPCMGSYSSSFEILDEVTDLVFRRLQEWIRFNAIDFASLSAGTGRGSDRDRFAPQG
jgi:L-iditol 2-dehydrogenase